MRLISLELCVLSKLFLTRLKLLSQVRLLLVVVVVRWEGSASLIFLGVLTLSIVIKRTSILSITCVIAFHCPILSVGLHLIPVLTVFSAVLLARKRLKRHIILL